MVMLLSGKIINFLYKKIPTAGFEPAKLYARPLEGRPFNHSGMLAQI